jgi:competence protein ComEA
MFDDRSGPDDGSGPDDRDDLRGLGGWTPGDVHDRPEPDGLTRPATTLRDFVRDRLPLGLRGARTDLGARAAAALAALALLAAVVAILLAWRSSARPAGTPAASSASRPVAVPAPSADSASAALVSSPGIRPAPGAASATSAGSVVVEVAGKVHRPGVVTVAAGSRVTDAIRAAGGLLPGTSTEGLSLARKLVDGEQLLVGVPPPPGAAVVTTGPSSGATGGPGQPVDLNAATVADLDALPGIGPVLAQRVIDWRDEHGGFSSVDQLREVSGVGDKKFESLAGLVRV